MIRLVLPWPISTNALWRGAGKGGKRHTYLTKKAKDFKEHVAATVILARANGDIPRETLTGRVRYTMTLYPPTRHRRDISNAIKIVEDALTYAHVWADDEQVDRLTVTRGPVVKDGRAVIEIEQLC